MINSQTSVREIAIHVPDSTRLFEKLKIDYCCGGNQPLTEACAAAGLDADLVVDMLTELSRTPEETSRVDLASLSLAELITHIVNTHHVFTKNETNRVEALTEKVINAHRPNHPELIHLGELIHWLCADLRRHMAKEEEVLFPYIVAMETAASQGRPNPFAPFGNVSNPVRMMTREHDMAGEILRELRLVTSDYVVPVDACISYETLYKALAGFEKDLHQHIHLENNILFPRAVALEARTASSHD